MRGPEASGRPQDAYWPAHGLGGALRPERHFGSRTVLCYSDRPAHVDAMLAAAAGRFPGNEALVGGGLRLSYAELDRQVGLVAGNLLSSGLAAGDRVALLVGNRPEFLVSALACTRAGLICVPMGTRQTRPELAYVVSDCGAAALIFEDRFSASVPLPEEVPSLRHRFVVGGATGGEPYDALLRPVAVVPPAQVSEDDCAFILYTSGTTGKPKGAMLSHLGVVHSAITFARCFGLDETDRAVVAVPASHVTGLVGVMLSTLCGGGCSILMNHFKTRDFLELAARERMTYTIVVPTIYTLCVMDRDLGAYDLASWRIGCFGGAPMPEATIQALSERLPNLVLSNAYGATETTSPSTVMPPGQTAAHPRSVGQVVPCGEIIVVDEHGQPLPPGVPGELWIRGPMVVPGYWNRPDANATSFTDGFWHSGDIGAIDTQGFVSVFDRAKDMINRGGYKIFSAEVENSISHHPDVLECAVIGRPDPVLGERVHAFVVPRRADLTAEQIQSFCRERMADYKVPEFIHLVNDPLPRNANGKVQKAVLRQHPSCRSPQTASGA